MAQFLTINPLFGYGAFLIVVLGGCLLAVAMSRGPGPRQLLARQILVTVFVATSFIIFLHVTPVLRAWETPGFPILDGARLLYPVTGIVAAAAMIQMLLLFALPTLFLQMLVPALVGLAIWIPVLPMAGGGIINTVWALIFIGSLSAYLILAKLFSTIGPMIEGTDQISDLKLRRDVLDSIRSEMNGLLKMGLTSFLALGASTGVSMTILFRDGQSAWSNPMFQLNATKLVAGFSLVSAGLVLWLLRPYLEAFEKLQIRYLRLGRPSLSKAA